MFKKIILLSCFVLCALLAFAQELPPKSNTLVTDFTNTLSADNKQQLERKLETYNDSTSTQIAIVIMKSVGEYDINEYAQKVGRAWGIGTKGKNNGIIVLVAIGDRKVAIQTGYGAEGAVPDAITHQIIENDLKPHFKDSDYYGGLDAGTDDLIKYMKGEYKGDQKAHSRGGGGGSAGIIVIIVIVILILIFRNRGGGGHIIDSRGGASPFWWFLGGAFLGRESGGGGWGGFSGGGDSGGGDSGGGFGGFGGGDFGGGGSSGSW